MCDETILSKSIWGQISENWSSVEKPRFLSGIPDNPMVDTQIMNVLPFCGKWYPFIIRPCTNDDYLGFSHKIMSNVLYCHTACLENRRSRVRTPLWPSSFKETKCFFPAHSQRFNISGRLRDQEVACSASDRQGANFEFCVGKAVSYHTTLKRYSSPS